MLLNKASPSEAGWYGLLLPPRYGRADRMASRQEHAGHAGHVSRGRAARSSCVVRARFRSRRARGARPPLVVGAVTWTNNVDLDSTIASPTVFFFSDRLRRSDSTIVERERHCVDPVAVPISIYAGTVAKQQHQSERQSPPAPGRRSTTCSSSTPRRTCPDLLFGVRRAPAGA